MDELNRTVQYLCSGPIDGLRLRVTLRRVSGSITYQVVRDTNICCMPPLFCCIFQLTRAICITELYRLYSILVKLCRLATAAPPQLVHQSLRSLGGKTSCQAAMRPLHR